MTPPRDTAAGTFVGSCMPLPPKFQFQRGQRQARGKRPPEDAEPAEEAPEPGEAPAKGAKQLHVTTSKIMGTAQPHRPRIGPEFQADVPPLPSQPFVKRAGQQ